MRPTDRGVVEQPNRPQQPVQPRRPTTRTALIVVAIVVAIVIAIAAIVVGTWWEREVHNMNTVGGAVSSESTTLTTAKPKEWVTIATLSGSSIKSGGIFTLTGDSARVTYSVTIPGGMSFAFFHLYIMEEGTDLESEGHIPEIEVEGPLEGSTVLCWDPGNYYLAAQSANCEWQVTIEEQR